MSYRNYNGKKKNSNSNGNSNSNSNGNSAMESALGLGVLSGTSDNGGSILGNGGFAGLAGMGFSGKPDKQDAELEDTASGMKGTLSLFGSSDSIEDRSDWDTDPDGIMPELPDNGPTRLAMESQLSAADVSLSPDEAFDGVESGSMVNESSFVYNDPIEADTMAFVAAEESRSSGQTRIEDPFGQSMTGNGPDISQFEAPPQLQRFPSGQEQGHSAYSSHQDHSSGRKPVTMDRSRPTGRMVEERTESVPGRTVDRRGNSGRFVSQDRTEPGVERSRGTGKFVPEGEDV